MEILPFPEGIPPLLEQIAREYLEAMHEGFKICPTCKQPIEQKQQKGECLYASPSGHRLGFNPVHLLEEYE